MLDGLQIYKISAVYNYKTIEKKSKHHIPQAFVWPFCLKERLRYVTVYQIYCLITVILFANSINQLTVAVLVRTGA